MEVRWHVSEKSGDSAEEVVTSVEGEATEASQSAMEISDALSDALMSLGSIGVSIENEEIQVSEQRLGLNWVDLAGAQVRSWTSFVLKETKVNRIVPSTAAVDAVDAQRHFVVGRR